MGKKRIIKKRGSGYNTSLKTRALSKVPNKKIDEGVLYINATYNNTSMTLTSKTGDVLCWSSSGSLGFKGARKGTPYAAAKVGELLGDKALQMGMKEASIMIKGIGIGRESAIRGFTSRGINLGSIKDITPIPFNGPRPPKARRV